MYVVDQNQKFSTKKIFEFGLCLDYCCFLKFLLQRMISEKDFYDHEH
jgi:hypothetical protein